MGPEAKRQKIDSLKQQQKKGKKVKANQTYSLDHCIAMFKPKIREGPYYICSVCNKIFHRKSVLALLRTKYNSKLLFTDTNSFDGKEYICKTCYSKVLNGKVPCCNVDTCRPAVSHTGLIFFSSFGIAHVVQIIMIADD